MTDIEKLRELLPCEDPEEPCDQDGRDEHRWCDNCIARGVIARAGLTLLAESPGEGGKPRCIFTGCVATWKHYHGGFPGGYDNPADPEGPPIPFEGEDPDPTAVRDYNGAALPAPDTGALDVERLATAMFNALGTNDYNNAEGGTGMTLTLGTIEEEAAACRAAWKAKPRAKYGVHIHHEAVVERLTEPIENRIVYILRNKPKKEQALRLRLMRPITAAAWAEYQKAKAAAWAEYEKAKAAAWAEYQKATAAAWAEYQKVEAAALAEYRKVEAPALAEYGKAKAAARAEYEKAKAAAWAEYQKAKAPAWAEYLKVTAAALAEYRKVEAPAWAEYEKVEAPALAEYEKATAAAHKAICPTPDCPWDGRSIFGDDR